MDGHDQDEVDLEKLYDGRDLGVLEEGEGDDDEDGMT